MNSRSLIYAVILALLLLLIPVRSFRRIVSIPPEETLRCAIPSQDAAFHRSMLQKYALDKGLEVSVSVFKGEGALDSLRHGALDLVVVCDPSIEQIRGLHTSRAFADGSVWAVREDEVEAIRHINQWITELTASERFNLMQERYFAGKTISLTTISQYDNILRACADSIGWDWRLLAAVVYHESRFNNAASSSKGATGLMQIRSRNYSEEVLLNPATNISVGSRYLLRLEQMFLDQAASPMEAIKFALAAYNMGEGRVGQLLQQAAADGRDATRWDSLKELLPEGHHTRSYVDQVLDTYAYYSKIYPR